MLECHFSLQTQIFGEMWVGSPSAKCCNSPDKTCLQWAKSNLGERAGARWPVKGSDHVRIILASSAHVNDASTVFSKFLSDFGMSFSWQAQYLLMLEGASCCSPHCKWRFICEDDQSWESFFVAGATFGDVGGWVLLLPHSLFVAGAAFGDVGLWVFDDGWFHLKRGLLSIWGFGPQHIYKSYCLTPAATPYFVLEDTLCIHCLF